MRVPARALLACAALAIGASQVRADDVTKAAKIEQLLTATHSEALIVKSRQQMKTIMHQMIVQSAPSMEGNPKLKDIEQVVQDEVTAATKWELLKPDFVKIYAATFSEDDIDGLLKFYQSPVGQSVVDKMPEVQSQIMLATQQRVQTMLPEMQKKIQELMEKDPKDAKPDAAK